MLTALAAAEELRAFPLNPPGAPAPDVTLIFVGRVGSFGVLTADGLESGIATFGRVGPLGTFDVVGILGGDVTVGTSGAVGSLGVDNAILYRCSILSRRMTATDHKYSSA